MLSRVTNPRAQAGESQESGASGPLRITILVDNEPGQDLESEHGLSLWVESEGTRLLFDTGQGGVFLRNARRLSIPLESADAIVLSHGHYDHAGGLAQAMEVAPRARLVLHSGSLVERYSRSSQGTDREVGVPQHSRLAVETAPAGRVHWVETPTLLSPRMGVTGTIPRDASYEDVGGPFFLARGGERPDPILDDQALWIHTQGGVVACLGCGHSGIVNTLSWVRALAGMSRIRAVLGGFHLLSASSARLEETLDALEDLDPALVVPCHCTGRTAMRALKSRLGDDRVVPGHTGMVHRF